MNTPAVAGLELARRFFHDAVEPIIRRHLPDLRYGAALIGFGSEVLGFDDEMSRDHHWGPRALLFLRPEDRQRHAEGIHSALSNELPHSFLGFPTNFSEPDPTDHGTQLLEETQSGPVRHRVEIRSIGEFLKSYLGVSDYRRMEAYDWLTLPQQKLRSLVAGEVFRDDLGELEEMRRVLAYYPRDVWLFLMASAWQRISQEEHLMGRAGIAGDEVGSAIIASRLVRDIMRLCYLQERTYAPYAKWFGRGFQELSCGAPLYPTLRDVLIAPDWQSRQTALVPAYETVAKRHNRLGITRQMPERARQFFGRPFQVIAIEGFAEALLDEIDPAVLTDTMGRSPIGGIDQFTDSTDLLQDTAYRPVIRELYR
jgi:hypothetical protein